MTIKILDLFAGVSGLSLGFEMVKTEKGNSVFELWRAVEIDKYACKTLRKLHGERKIIEGDLTKKEIHKKVIADCKGVVSVVVGGIPCQSFSLIGPRSGDGEKKIKFRNDKRDTLYTEFRDIVKEIRPKIIVIENVKGILSKKNSKGKKIIDKIITDFEKMNYNFTNKKNNKKFMLINAADFGVPQKRERVILIGINKKWKNISSPWIKPTHYNPKSENGKEYKNKKMLPYVTLFEAIGDLPELSAKITKTDLSEKDFKKIQKRNKNKKNGTDKVLLNKKEFKKHFSQITLSGKKFFEFIRPNGYEFIDNHVARSQQLSDILLFKKMKQGETAKEFFDRKPDLAGKLIKYDMKSFKDKYRKQCFDSFSTTVFAHLEKDGNRFIHPKEARTFTPREVARIQSFPDDMIFEGPLSKKFRQIGNAVPPLLSYNIGKAIYQLMI